MIYLGLGAMALSGITLYALYRFCKAPEIIIPKDEYDLAVERQQRKKNMKVLNG